MQTLTERKVMIRNAVTRMAFIRIAHEEGRYVCDGSCVESTSPRGSLTICPTCNKWVTHEAVERISRPRITWRNM